MLIVQQAVAYKCGQLPTFFQRHLKFLIGVNTVRDTMRDGGKSGLAMQD